MSIILGAVDEVLNENCLIGEVLIDTPDTVKLSAGVNNSVPEKVKSLPELFP